MRRRLTSTVGALSKESGADGYLSELIVHGGEYRRRGRLLAEFRSRGVPERLAGLTMFASRTVGRAEVDALGARIGLLDALDGYRATCGLGPEEVLILPCTSGVAITEAAHLRCIVVVTENLTSSDPSAAVAIGREAIDSIALARASQPRLFD